MVWHHLYLYALSLLTTTFALNFSVNSTSLTSCRDVQLIWKGGQAPYTVTVVASQSYPENYSLSPSSSQVDVDLEGDMSWNYTITYPPGTHIAFIMSDATGLGTGGSTDVFLLADPGDGLDCYSSKAQPQGIDWMTYTDPNAPQQCKGASIIWSTPSSETSPTYILGATPDQVLQFNAGTGMHKLVWDVDVAAGTSLLLQGWDAQTSMAIGRASPYINIASSGDSSCLPSAPLSSEGDSNSSTTTTPMRTVTATMTIVPPNNGLKGGEIAGLVIGILAFIVITQVLFYHFCWKKRLNAPFSRLRETKKSGEQEALDMTEFLDPFTFSASTTNLSTAVSSPIESERDPFRRATDDDPDEVLSAMAEFDKHSIRSISTHTEPVSSLNSPISAVSTTAILQRAQTPQADTYTHHSVHSHVNSYGRESSAEMTDTLQTTSSKERRLAGPRRIATTRSGRDAEGGVYIHEDAGRLARSRTEPVEDLPPRYDPSWQDS